MISTIQAFQVDRVTVEYPAVRAVDDVSLVVHRGERVALVGPSGSGKTTLLRLLNGMLRPTQGKVQVFGRATTELTHRQLRALRAQIGFVHQDLSLIPNLRVLHNVLSGRMGQASLWRSVRMMLWPRLRETEAIHALLSRVGIEEKLFQRTDRLSGGQQQRVAIARALFQQPAALLADEPVSSVDPARARDTVELLTQISREDGLTLCMSLHNLPLAREYFSRLIGMRNGQIVFDRRTRDLTDEEFERLYELSDAEMMSDHARA